MQNAETLFGDDEGNRILPPSTLSKSSFGQALGLSPARVSQLIKMGLPVEPNGRIHLGRGRQWYVDNVDGRRQRGVGGSDASPRGARAQLEQTRADLAALELATKRGQLVDRATVERTTFTQARNERDSWLAWVGRASATIAAETGADATATFAVLDRLVREQLAGFADSRLEDL